MDGYSLLAGRVVVIVIKGEVYLTPEAIVIEEMCSIPSKDSRESLQVAQCSICLHFKSCSNKVKLHKN